ncbi:hypothetical protein RRX38_19225 [Pseudomonas sp. DTU_2021_1001937_2_SI_NGA_ILE_001]|uniref:hypothetical protein n=1 Tax=Pseudomonas sp. DTU_2021_1001937_2_SI_NGA_ILE_001 TaxID=3077589 RepID=UPI0028FC2588|nr:hypothetical protein [Pseudomonas sp. DTU_2021_1001937_2_SI_NGA_ILE_001]WNW13198.1 hypothetical protein RRX38_19225 [Pseudomonas sp. DTU_2021_1001937_2_SI_NGA_ILE_001]
MSTPFKQFTSPAEQAPKDYQQLGLEQELPQFETDWNNNLAGWTESAIIGNPWTGLNDAPRSGYYNPLVEGFGDDVAPIEWTPFPNRLIAYLTQPGSAANPQLGGSPLSMQQVMALADNGEIEVNGTTLSLYDPQASGTLLNLPTIRCPQIDWNGPYKLFSPYGPRGWLDEYCEWSITRDADGKMRSVMFTCENPAYYLTMWRIDPRAVLGLYQTYIDPAVQLEDLYLRYQYDQPTGKKGEPVLDPTTGQPAYDVTNKWNSGTARVPGQYGGALHLTSAPNTLSAEIYLAGAATIQRPDASSANPQALICCSQYGQNFRNSDPTIGFNANQLAGSTRISLTNPVGLYLQQPLSFANWKGPQGQDVSQYWKITRGTAGTGPNGKDQILHAVLEVPVSAGFSINDITIDGQPIEYVGQIANQMKVALSATGMGNLSPAITPCVADRTTGIQPYPVQLVPLELFYGASPSDLPAWLAPGTSHSFVLVVQGAAANTTAANARIQFSNPGVTAQVTEFLENATPVPGKTTDSGTQGYVLTISVAKDAAPGLVQLRALNPDESANPSAAEHPWASALAVVPGV